MTKLSKQIDFSRRVEEYAGLNNETLVESCFVIADELGVQTEDIPSQLSVSLRDKMQLEGVKNKTVKPDSTGSLDFLM